MRWFSFAIAVCFSLGACVHEFKNRGPRVREPSSLPDARLEIDGTMLTAEATKKLLTGEPIELLHEKRSVKMGSLPLKPHILKRGDFAFVHSQRYVTGPRAQGQPQFDTFLFGCEFLPPSPLDRVVTEGIRMKVGDQLLIEEYPDHAVTEPAQTVALVTCAP